MRSGRFLAERGTMTRALAAVAPLQDHRLRKRARKHFTPAGYISTGILERINGFARKIQVSNRSLMLPVKIHLNSSFFGEFIEPVLEGKHHIAPNGIGAGLPHIVQFADANHILILIQ